MVDHEAGQDAGEADFPQVGRAALGTTAVGVRADVQALGAAGDFGIKVFGHNQPRGPAVLHEFEDRFDADRGLVADAGGIEQLGDDGGEATDAGWRLE